MMASCSRSNSTSAGRILLAAPEVNGNWQMKISPNISVQGVVNGVRGRIVPQELFVSPGTPLRLVGGVVGQNDDAGFARLRQLRRNFPWDGQRCRAAQLCREFNRIHVKK